MKKNTLITCIVLLLSISIVSCKNNPKKEIKETPQIGYTLDQSTSKVGWTGYKTTDKVPVKGEFKKITISNPKSSGNASELLDGVEFSIPVSSIFSNNEDRDGKLQKFFFGIMDQTELLSGKITLKNESTGSLTLKMNAMSKSLPINYTFKDNKFTFSGTMNLDEWDGQAAIASINKVCENLHKGADGVSKTWNEVEINASISVIKN
jgi:polyisoprenoid-binding protein YceI